MANWIPILKTVTINETTIETYWWYPAKLACFSKSIKATPILAPKEIPIKTTLVKIINIFLHIFEDIGNPTFYQCIY